MPCINIYQLGGDGRSQESCSEWMIELNIKLKSTKCIHGSKRHTEEAVIKMGNKNVPKQEAGSDLGPIINSQEQRSWVLQNSEATDLDKIESMYKNNKTYYIVDIYCISGFAVGTLYTFCLSQ